MKFSSRQPEPAAMQLAPMIDIVFLLLIFFIVTWQFSRSETELNVSVPTAEEGSELNRPKGEIIINVLPDGVIRVEGSTVDLPQLLDKLSAIAKQFKNQPVRIRGDGSVDFQRIVEVIDTCEKAGIWNISFATQRPAPKE
ncbi:MAG: biopolymer transporter ExbD [Akkermansiaceae bacterium]|jgi:biopolymer transport protein ExbD|nr:biopolymer transporter ExbD [Akkermansiaceae bacterium]